MNEHSCAILLNNFFVIFFRQSHGEEHWPYLLNLLLSLHRRGSESAVSRISRGGGVLLRRHLSLPSCALSAELGCGNEITRFNLLSGKERITRKKTLSAKKKKCLMAKWKIFYQRKCFNFSSREWSEEFKVVAGAISEIKTSFVAERFHLCAATFKRQQTDESKVFSTLACWRSDVEPTIPSHISNYHRAIISSLELAHSSHRQSMTSVDGLFLNPAEGQPRDVPRSN